MYEESLYAHTYIRAHTTPLPFGTFYQIFTECHVMLDVLQQCKNNFGEPPRLLSFWQSLTYFRVSKPGWLKSDPEDGLNTHYRNLNKLYSNGIVTWGHIVQANSMIFEEGDFNCPAEVVYSLEDADQVEPEYLRQVAISLYQLKGTTPDDPDLQPFADHLANEQIRVYGLPVPTSISPTIRCRISVTMLVRKHLPQKRLCTTLIPIIASRREPYIVTTLPERYWPPELIEWWSN